MDVTVEIVGGETREVSLDDGTYADLLEGVGLHPQEATALVDDRPVPADRPVDADRVRVLRLVVGG